MMTVQASDRSTSLHCDGSKILMVFSLLPYPHRANGHSVRYFPIIQYLSRRHQLDIAVITENPLAEDILAGLKDYCRKLVVIQKRGGEGRHLGEKIRVHIPSLLPWTPPLLYAQYDAQKIISRIIQATEGETYDALVWVSSQCSSCLFPILKRIAVKRVVLDFIDSPTLWAERKRERSARASARERYECWKIRRWEKRMPDRVTSTIYISPIDAGFVQGGGRQRENTNIVPNGIGVEDYSPEVKSALPTPNIGFLGHMGYPPNVEASVWLYEKIYLPLAREIPGLSLILIGRKPAEAIRKLSREPGVIVTGEVENIWPYVNAVDLFVFPLQIGGGIKNKILETMYAGRPVVTTRIGNEGVDGIDGTHLFLCEGEDDFLHTVRRLLRVPEERESVGRAANEFVRERFSWMGLLPRFEKIILGS